MKYFFYDIPLARKKTRIKDQYFCRSIYIEHEN
jgi:hypothetical protein